jgi:hypothetical protein
MERERKAHDGKLRVEPLNSPMDQEDKPPFRHGNAHVMSFVKFSQSVFIQI